VSDPDLQARRQVNIYAADQALWLFNRRDVLNRWSIDRPAKPSASQMLLQESQSLS